MLYGSTLAHAAAFSEEVTAEPTLITGMGTVNGIVDQMTKERMLRKGTFGADGEGTVTIVYLQSLFTEEQFKTLERASVKVPSLSEQSMAISSVGRDGTWVTILANVK